MKGEIEDCTTHISEESGVMLATKINAAKKKWNVYATNIFPPAQTGGEWEAFIFYRKQAGE